MDEERFDLSIAINEPIRAGLVLAVFMWRVEPFVVMACDFAIILGVNSFLACVIYGIRNHGALEMEINLPIGVRDMGASSGLEFNKH